MGILTRRSIFSLASLLVFGVACSDSTGSGAGESGGGGNTGAGSTNGGGGGTSNGGSTGDAGAPQGGEGGGVQPTGTPILVAVGYGGRRMSSLDGVTWDNDI